MEDTALHARVVRDARRRFRRWPSAYASAWVVREYKRLGGRFSGPPRSGGVARWMRERWVQVAPALDGRTRACGAPGRDGRACRPTVRVSAATPPTLREVVRAHGEARVRQLAARKSRCMRGRVDWRAGTFRCKVKQ